MRYSVTGETRFLVRAGCRRLGFARLLSQVSRRSVIRALEDKGSVMLVPGGQAELVHTHRASGRLREWVVYTGHKGVLAVHSCFAATSRSGGSLWHARSLRDMAALTSRRGFRNVLGIWQLFAAACRTHTHR